MECVCHSNLSQFLRSILQIGPVVTGKKRDERWERKPEGGVYATQISIPQQILSINPSDRPNVTEGRRKRNERWERKPEGGMYATQISIP
jgi:hypothetical protein